MKKFVSGLLVGILVSVCVFMFANWYVERHENDVHVTVVGKEPVTWTNETTGAVISTGLEVFIETDDGQMFSKVVENTGENHYEAYKIGNDFWIPFEMLQENWN